EDEAARHGGAVYGIVVTMPGDASRSRLAGMRATASAQLSGLSPSYFALVLWLLTLLRVLHHRRLFVDDLFSHQRGLGFFTIVAGTCVLGVQMILIAH